jgi:hypothetical protein
MTFVPEGLRLLAQQRSTGCRRGQAAAADAAGRVRSAHHRFLIFEPHGLAAIWARVRRSFPPLALPHDLNGLPQRPRQGDTMTNSTTQRRSSDRRRHALGPFAIGVARAGIRATSSIGAAQPITGVFSFAGVR